MFNRREAYRDQNSKRNPRLSGVHFFRAQRAAVCIAHFWPSALPWACIFYFGIRQVQKWPAGPVCWARPCLRHAAFVRYHGMTAEQLLWAIIKSELLTPHGLVFRAENFYYTAMRAKIDAGSAGRSVKRGAPLIKTLVRSIKQEKKIPHPLFCTGCYPHQAYLAGRHFPDGQCLQPFLPSHRHQLRHRR